jgi:hypothetical protein
VRVVDEREGEDEQDEVDDDEQRQEQRPDHVEQAVPA